MYLATKAVTSRLLRRSAPRNDGHLGCHCERSEAISMIAGLGTDYQVRTTSSLRRWPIWAVWTIRCIEENVVGRVGGSP